MPVELVSAEEAMALMMHNDGLSCIIDARSEDEFALDHLPMALNWPSLTNEERIKVGTLYKQVGAFEANKLGASLVAANIAKHIEKYLLSFGAVNGRNSVTADHYKYERVCLLIVDFSKAIPKIYNTDAELIADNLLPADTIASIEKLSFPNFITDLLDTYSERFGTGKFS